MKFSIIFLILAFSHYTLAQSTTAASRVNGLLRFLAQQENVRNYALHTIIGQRCSRYLPEEKKNPCLRSVRKMIALLDYDLIILGEQGTHRSTDSWAPSSFVFVAFKTNLLALLSQERTAAYLGDLNQKLYDYIAGRKSRPNIWEITKLHFRSDYMASLVIAALFQDTGPTKLHLAWIERSGTRGNKQFLSNKELLARVIDTINLILDSSEDNYRSLFYPKEIQRDLNRNIYHFYVPLYLAKEMEQSGLGKENAYTAALMLTLSYEFVTASKDYRYLYLDPSTIRGVHKVKDIFGGYCGANIGVRGMNFFRSFEVIKDSFMRSTADTVELLLRH